MKLMLLIIVLITSIAIEAGTVSRLVEFQPNTKAQSEEVNAEFDNILATINGAISSVNIQDGGVATADIGTAAVTAAKISPYSVTQVKMGEVGQQLSSIITSQTVAGLSTADAASVTISTYGRPVFVGLIPASVASTDTTGVVVSLTNADSGIGTRAVGNILLARNTQSGQSQHITRWIPSVFAAATQDIVNSPSNTLRVELSPSQFFTIDPVTAGTWTYAVRISGNSAGSSIQLKNLRLIAFEL